MYNRVRNLDSGVRVSRDTLEYAFRGLSATYTASRVPIYLVSPNTIDKYCSYRGIDIEYSRRVVEHTERCLAEKRCDVKKLLDELWDRYTRSYQTLGCFLPHLDPASGADSPSILICPERIQDSASSIASELGVESDSVFRELFRIVLVHEATHATIWRLSRGASSKIYSGTRWGQVLEEGFAQLGAYTEPSPNPSLYHAVMDKLSARQPLEYNLWRVLAYLGLDEKILARYAITWYAYQVGGRTPSLIPLLAPLRSEPYPLWLHLLQPGRPSPELCWRLHMDLRAMGPEWHYYFHYIIEPLICKSQAGQAHSAELVALALLDATARLVSA